MTGVHQVIRICHGGEETVYYADIECSVDLDPAQKGVHMSRFAELFAEAIESVVLGEALAIEDLAGHIATRVLERQGSLRSYARIEAKYPGVAHDARLGADLTGDLHADRRRVGDDGRDAPRRRRARARAERVSVRAGHGARARERAARRHGVRGRGARRASSTRSRSRRTTSVPRPSCSSARRASRRPRS